MPLDWTFAFLRVNPETRTNPDVNKKPEISLIASYRDGKPNFHAGPYYKEDILHAMEPMIILLNYVAFFPEKDFSKMKLRTEGNQFALHHLDKRFLDSGFLGCLSVSEWGETTSLEFWGVEEMMSEYVFEYFYGIRFKSDPEPYEFNKFHEWLSSQVDDFYQDRQEARVKVVATQSNLSSTSELKSNPSETISCDVDNITTEHWWDIQLINEFGTPLTDMISFIDRSAFSVTDDSAEVSQNLESMSLTALKLLIDQQGGDWNIEYLKGKLKNEMGFQYTFFKKFNVGPVRYLLIMNSSIYDFDTQVCLQLFKGNEFDLLNHIAGQLKLRGELFNTSGNFVSPEIDKVVRRLILDAVGAFK